MLEESRDFEVLAEKFKAIGHPVRIEILSLLCNCEKLKVKNIYQSLNIDQPSISRHLGIMRRSGVLERIQIANDTFYCLCSKSYHTECIKRCFIETDKN